MKKGYLSQYFKGVGFKRLTEVEINPEVSRQHEFQGVRIFREILGTPAEKTRFRTRFMYMSDRHEYPITDEGFMTWSDVRRNNPNRSAEYHLYYSNNQAVSNAAAGDMLVVAVRPDDTLLAIITEKNSTIENQISWLFECRMDLLMSHTYVRTEELGNDRFRIGLAASQIMEQIGVELEEEAPDYLDRMLSAFGGTFPATKVFSEYARNTLRHVSAKDDPDAALVAWMEQEEKLFRTLERHIVGEKIRELVKKGTDDTDQYISVVQSALQRRKSRAGSALENHLEQVFGDHGITYTRTGVTENRLKPDFIFPGIRDYHYPRFSEARLTMLAAKSTCKDRWRQILNEAKRIFIKHLLTLEPGISENQTDEMTAEKVQLVIPLKLHVTFTQRQRHDLMDLSSFISLVQYRQDGNPVSGSGIDFMKRSGRGTGFEICTPIKADINAHIDFPIDHPLKI